MNVGEILALNVVPTITQVSTNTPLGEAGAMMSNEVINNASNINDDAEIKFKKVSRFVHFSKEIRARNDYLHNMSSGLTTIRELWTEYECGLNGGEPLVELELRTKGAWCKDTKNCGATAWSRRSATHKEMEIRLSNNFLSEEETIDQLEAELLGRSQENAKSNPDIAGFNKHLRRLRKMAINNGE